MNQAQQPEALRLATRLSEGYSNLRSDLEPAAAELRRLHARVQELERTNSIFRGALNDIASGEITRSHCTGPHCVEEFGIATADELSARAGGALDWEEWEADDERDHSDEDAAIAAGKIQAAVQGRTT